VYAIRIIAETSYPIAFKMFAFCCILIDGDDYYYRIALIDYLY